MRNLCAMALLASTPVLACDGLEATDAWVREAPPGARVMVGYVHLHNAGATRLRIDGASSADFGAVELHRTVIEDGMARMLRDQTIDMAAGGTAVLEPGGLHIMLFRPSRRLAAGDQVNISLHCGGSRTTLPFTLSTGAP
jgi:periplasmic copper chaperone A